MTTQSQPSRFLLVLSRAMTMLLLFCATLALSGCGGSGGKGLDYTATGKKFAELLFAGNYDEAKKMALPDHTEQVEKDIATFAPIREKYEFQEMKAESWRSWFVGPNPEADRRVEVTFQYKAKAGEDDWHIGMIAIRVMEVGGRWGVAEVVVERPKS